MDGASHPRKCYRKYRKVTIKATGLSKLEWTGEIIVKTLTQLKITLSLRNAENGFQMIAL